MKNRFKRIGAFILREFAVNLARFNQRVQQLLPLTENASAPGLIGSWPPIMPVPSGADDVPPLFWVADTQANCQYLNPTAFSFTARSLLPEGGEIWTAGVHPDDLPHCLDTFLSAFHARQPFSLEYRRRQANGEYRWVLDHGIPQFQDHQEFVGYLGTCVDVTQLKQTAIHAVANLAKANLWRSRYEAAGRANSQILYEYDVSLHGMTWNRDVENLLGYTAAQLNSQDLTFWLSLVHPADHAPLQAAIQAIVTLKQPIQQLEYRLRRKDGRYIWVQDSNEILLDEAGNANRVIGFITDITPRKQAETEQQQLLKLLSDMKFALDQAAIVVTTDANGNIIDANDRFCEISQSSRAELVGQTHPLIQSRTHPAPFFQALWQTISQGQVWKGEVKNYTRLGSEYWVDLVIVPFLDPLGEPYQHMAICFDITERKQAEAALRQSQARLAEAQQLAHLGNWEFSLQSRKIIWSDELFRMFGRDPCQSEPSYADYLEFYIHPDDRTALQQYVECAITTGQGYTFTYRAMLPDGSIRYHEARGNVEYDAQGHVIRLFGTAQDITPAKLAEIALRESEAQNRAILLAMPDMMMVIDGEGRCVRHSDNVCVGEGTWMHSNSVGLHLTEILPPMVAYQWVVAMHRVLDSGEMQTFEQKLQQPDRIHYEEVRIVPYQADKVLCMVRDVSDRKEAELALQDSQQFIQQVADSSPNVIYIYDLGQQRNVYVNREISTFLGYTAEEIRSRIDQSLASLLHPDDLTVAMHHFEQLARVSDGTVIEFEYRMQHKNGEWRWFISRDIVFQRDSEGTVTQVLGNAQDITERKRAEQKLKDSEAFLDSIINAITDPIFVKDEQHRWVLGNAAFCDFVGAANAEFAGKTDYDFFPPEQAQVFWEHDEAVLTTGLENFNEEVGNHAKLGLRTIAIKKTRFLDSAGHRFIVGYSRDVTEQKQAEAQLASQNVLLARIAQGEPLTQILHAMILELEQTLQGSICVVLITDEFDQLQHGASASLPETFVERLHHLPIGEGRGSCGTAAHRQQTVIVSDIASDPLWIDFRQLALAHGLRACWSTPILASDGAVLGTFGVYYREVREPHPYELGVIDQMANLAGIAMEQDQAAAKIRQSEEQLRLTLEFTGIGAWSWHPTTGDYSWNGKMEALLELPPGMNNMFQAWRDRIHPDDREQITSSLQQALATQTAFSEEYRYVLQNGQTVWRWVMGQGIYNETGDIVRVLGVVQDINDRKNVEVALRHSEAKNRAMLSAIPDLILRVKRDGTCVDFIPPATSPRVAFMPTQFNIAEVLAHDILQYQQERMAQAIATGELQVWEQELTRFGVPCEEEVRLVHCEDDEFLIVVRDITERKRAEKALRKSEAQYRQIVETANEGIWIIDTDNKTSFVNPKMAAMLGYTADEMLGKSMFEFMAEAEVENATQNIERRQQGITEQHDFKFRHQDGTDVWVLISTNPILDDAGQYIGSLGMITDIRDRKRTEIALRTAEERYSLATRAARVGVWEWHLKTNHVYIDPNIKALVGYADDDFPNDPEHWLQLSHPGDRDQIMAIVHDYLTGKIPELVFEHRMLHQDGSVLWVLARGELLRDEHGNPERLIGTDTDISDLKHAELALRRSEATKNAIIQAMPDLLIRMDGDGHYRELIRSDYLHVLMPNKPISEATVYDALPFNVAKQHVHYAKLAVDTNELQIFEKSLEIDGQLCHEEVRIVPLLDQEVLVIVRDITDRKQAEFALQEKEQQLNSLLNNIPHIAWLKDREGRFLAVNKPFAQACGFPLAQLAGLTDLDIWPQHLAAAYIQDDREVMASGQQKRVEEPLLTFEGGEKWIETIKTPILNAQGESIGTAGIAMDITERKQAELALQQLNGELELRVQQRTQELARSEQDLRTIFNNVYDAIFIHAMDGTVLDCNDRSLALFAATREQLITANVTNLTADATQLEMVPGIMQRVAAGESLQFEWQAQRFSDAAVLEVEVSLRSVTLANRPVIIACVRDIRDRKQAAQQLEAERLRLQLALEAADMGTWESDLETGIWSERTEAIFGYAPGTFPGDREAFLKLVHGDDQERVFGALAHSFATRSPYRVEYRINHLGGRQRWVAVNGTVVDNEDGSGRRIVGVALDITERKQAEQALRESEERFRQLAENVGEVFWLTDLQCKLLYLSPSFQKVWGRPTEFLFAPETHLLDTIHPDDYDRVKQRIPSIAKLQGTYDIEYRILRPNGEVRWIRDRAFLIHNGAGEVYRIGGIAEDISDRKQAEQALRDSEERLRLALTAANQGLYDLNVQTGDALVSPEYATMLGYDSATFQETNAKWLARLHPDDVEAVTQTFRAYVAGEIPSYKVEFRQRTQDGQWKWILSLGKIVAWDETGQPLRMLGTHTDIDDRKRAEAQLREQEQFLRGIYEGVRQPIFVSDVLPGNQIRYMGWNPTAAQFVGRTTEEVAGKPIEEIFDAAEGAEIASRYAQCIQARHPVTFEERITFHQKTRWVLTTYNPLIDAEGNVYRVVGTVYDITERKQAEDALQQLNLELEQRVSDRTLELQQAMEAAETANRAKSTFLANMSHELRTPLNAILGFAQLMSRDLTLDAEKRNQLSIINRSGKHLLSLINDILEMSKIEAGCTTFSPNQFDLHTQIATLEEMFQLRAIEKGLQFIIEHDPSLPQYIETDENKLRQVLINLLGNAIKFTKHGYVRLRIQVQELDVSVNLQRSTSFSASTALVLHFTVEDTGIGIDANEVDSLFEPFIQSSNRHLSQEGTGLGLPISRQFVQLMGGELTVQTALGIGSSFSFAIPVKRVEVAEVFGPVARPILGLAPTQPPCRILVVEDNDTNRMLLMQLLQSVGFDVRFARDGQAAIAEWETWQPQLIWMDIRMPGIDGYEATRRIRSREQLSSAPPTVIIALTANAFEEERAQVLQVGCDDFMRKPFQDTELLEKIAAHLGVQYLYAEPDQGGDERVTPAAFDAIAALQRLPSALLPQLYQATVELNEQRLAALLEQVSPEHPDLVALLLKKLENFDFEYILQLLQKVNQSE